jgi:V/A-type H+-transporting ATPase subunit C
MFQKVNRNNRMNVAKLVSVLHFLEYEIRDIITIIEGIRYDVPVEEMKDFLIRDFT